MTSQNLHNHTITKEDLVQALAGHFFIPKTKCAEIMEVFLSDVIQFISQDGKLKVSGFGSFMVHDKKQRMGRNPRTGEPAVIAPRRSLSFRPSPLLKEKISKIMESR